MRRRGRYCHCGSILSSRPSSCLSCPLIPGSSSPCSFRRGAGRRVNRRRGRRLGGREGRWRNWGKGRGEWGDLGKAGNKRRVGGGRKKDWVRRAWGYRRGVARCLLRVDLFSLLFFDFFFFFRKRIEKTSGRGRGGWTISFLDGLRKIKITFIRKGAEKKKPNLQRVIIIRG